MTYHRFQRGRQHSSCCAIVTEYAEPFLEVCVSRLSTVALALMFAGLTVIGARAFSPPSPSMQAVVTPAFLQTGHCYRIAFPIEGAPSYKVLELLEAGWIRAEIDSGTAKAQRPSMWVNTSQMITLREVRCSE